MPADTGSLALLPPGDTGTDFIDDARDFVAWNTGILNPGPLAFFGEDVAVADPAGLYLDAHLPYTRLGNFAVGHLEIGTGRRNLRHSHWRNGELLHLT